MKVPSCVILAGGLATRLRPVTETIPKSLVNVAKEPFIAHQLRLIKSKGIERVVLCVGHLGNKIQDFVGSGFRFGLEVEYSFDGAILLGTGGSIKKAFPLFGETFFVMYGDSYLDIDYCDIFSHYCNSGKPGLMTIIQNENRWDTSNIVYEKGTILKYEKELLSPDMRYVDYGLGILNKKTFEEFSDSEIFDLSLVYQGLIKKNDLAGYIVEKRFYEIGSIQGIKETEKYILNKNRSPRL